MRELQRLATTILLLTISAAAQQAGTATASAAPDQALQNRYHEYTDALTKRDFATLDKIWASDYTFINPLGEVVTKAQRMSNLKSKATEFKAINTQQEKLHVHGDVVIDIGRATLQGAYSGTESSGEYRYMNVWMKKQGQWQLLANQLTLIK
jgi:ketosteroid isomerase-like protein